jgi:hypothetical protein
VAAGWDCWCGAKGLITPVCPWCGRRDPWFAPPPLPSERLVPPDPRYWGYVPPPPARVGVTPAVRVLGALIGLIVVAAGVVVERRAPDPYERTAAPRPRISASPLATGDALVVAKAREFVATFRGAAFLEETEPVLLEGEAFRRAYAGEDDEGSDADVPAEDGFDATLRGLQLASPGDDVGEEEDALLDDSVVGFYDSDTEQLVLRAGTLDPYAQLTLVHELTHAWQDQHYDLDALYDEVETQDEALALRALVEGDATRVEDAWRKAQPASVQNAIAKREDELFGPDDGDEPSRLQASLSALYGFPYEAGEDFAQYVWDTGSNAGLDAAFSEPPTTTAQVIHPEKYLPVDAPTPVPTPKAGGRVVDSGVLGEVGLIVTLARGDLDRSDVEAAAGWDGDAYVTWRNGSRTCTTVRVVMDTATQRDRLLAALRAQPLGPGGEVESLSDGVRFVSCS